MRRWVLLIGLSISLVAAIISYQWYQRSSPERWTSGNLLPNPDWNLPADDSQELLGWLVSGDVKRVNAEQGYVLDGNYALQIRGTNSWARAPEIKVVPGQQYRIAYQGLIDPGQATGSIEARIAVWLHWIDAEGDVIKLDKLDPTTLGYAADGSPTWTAILLETPKAPAKATSMAISFHPLTDEVLLLDNLSLNAAGVYVEPWPHGASAAVSFSIDWETAMGGYIHTRSTDPYTWGQAAEVGERSRQGTENLLKLSERYNIKVTWFANGYNFLHDNTTKRTWMGDPQFAWATPEHGWLADWSQRRWFGDDPYSSKAEAPGWYFGDLTQRLIENNHAIQSHTFSHLYSGLATLEEWRADLQAWNELAHTAGVEPATALAFAWGSTGGMTDGHWRALEQAGIDTIVRTHLPTNLADSADPLLIIDRREQQARNVQARDILVLPDVFLLPSTHQQAEAALLKTRAVGGVIDLWAHTSEIVDPAQVETWETFIQATATDQDIWVATIPEIAAYWRNIRRIHTEITAGDGSTDNPLQLSITNPSATTLKNVSLRIPGQIEHLSGNAHSTALNDRILIDLAPQSTTEIQIWLKS